MIILDRLPQPDVWAIDVAYDGEAPAMRRLQDGETVEGVFRGCLGLTTVTGSGMCVVVLDAKGGRVGVQVVPGYETLHHVDWVVCMGRRVCISRAPDPNEPGRAVYRVQLA